MVTLSVIGIVSVMVVGYCAAQSDDDDVTADCVDTSQQLPDGSYPVVDDDYCDDDDDDGGGGGAHYYSSGGSRAAYHWYYGGRRVGTHVRGGTTLRPSDVTISSRTGKSIQRGGFGGRSSSGS
ncbi:MULTISPECIES: hypothetical protein [unclassified Nonomuraea]|uniref:hypothetical protein n=1 Tax=unclassified Nonomuraea TaxID=2593643 RepID=UPI0033EB36A9